MKLLKMFFVIGSSLVAFGFSDEVRIRFASLAPQSSAWGKCLSGIARDVYKETKEVKIQVFYGGTMGDEGEIGDKIGYKQLDGGAFTGNGLGRITPEVRVLEIPGLFSKSSEADYVYDRIEKDLQPYFAKKGYYLISLAETGFAYFFSKKNISSVDDIRKTKMWMWKGDRLAVEFMKALKIAPIQVNFTEVVSSLQTGLIDGFYATPYGAAALQWDKEASFMLDMPMVDVTGGLVMSMDSWNKLSAKQKEVMSSVTKRFVRELTLANRTSDAETIQLFKKNGLAVNASKDPADLMARTGLEMEKGLAGTLVPAELIQKTRSLALEARKK